MVVTTIWKIIRFVLTAGVLFALTALISGRLNYWQGWMFSGLMSGVVLLLREAQAKCPELKEKRRFSKLDIRKPDTIWICLCASVTVCTPVLGLIDSGRFGRVDFFPPTVNIVGGLMMLVGGYIGCWAYLTNAWFAMQVEKQENQRVVSSGPYVYVRHPGYTGFVLWLIGMALSLGSPWALVLAAAGAALLIIRIRSEEALLVRRLSGYDEYRKTVRYRLVPFFW